MEQHPVPQNISSYQFHLVGDMTLKQFLELATGVVIGVIIYATALPGLIKWPLIFFSAISGAALAFVPFEERPLEQWIFAFFRSIYSPTLFHWEKQETQKYFQDESLVGSAFAKATADRPLSKLDIFENTYLSKITQLFSPTATATPAHSEDAVLAGRPLSTDGGSVLTMHPSDTLGTVTPAPAVEIKKDVQIPQTTFIKIDAQTNKTDRPHIFVEESGTPVNLDAAKVAQTLVGNPSATLGTVVPTVQAVFSTQAAPPSLPTIPNTVSGQVMDANGNIIEGAIMEIQDETGRPVRALKTNKAGHFLTVTALTDGKYQLHIEKEGFTFDPITFETSGGIIMPIAIRAK